MTQARIGTADIPDRTERARYFRELSYLELSALFAGPLKPGALEKWAEVAPRGAIGLVAPWVLTHRRAPSSSRLWRHDATVGDFRDSAPGRAALGPFRAAVDALGASHVIFRSPPLFAPSAANRDRLRAFFTEVATAETVGAARVWIPDGLWEPRAAVTFATELGLLCALDPLVVEPGQPPEIYYDLDLPALYLRISGLGRGGGSLRSEQLEDLAALLEHYEGLAATVTFESPFRWQDARNLKKLLDDGGGGETSSEAASVGVTDADADADTDDADADDADADDADDDSD